MSTAEPTATYDCELREGTEQPTLVVRTVAAVQDLPGLMGRAFGAVMQYLGELGEHPAGMPFAAYHNLDMEALDVEIGFPVARPLPGRGDLTPGVIPGGTMAVTLHAGPYAEIGKAYAALTAWVKEQGREPGGPVFEFYLNDPAEGVVPETEVVLPLRPV